MKLKIAVLPGDGIGPEISEQGVAVMTAVAEKFGHEVTYEYALCGADAIDKVGDPFPEATFQACMNADAVLFSAVGDPKYDNDPTATVWCSVSLRISFAFASVVRIFPLLISAVTWLRIKAFL